MTQRFTISLDLFMMLTNKFMKHIYIIVLLICTNISAKAVDFTLSERIGIGSYSMQDIKRFQENINEDLIYPMELTEDFPAYYYFRTAFVFENLFFIDRVATFFSFHSTGGRMSIFDPSGYAISDQELCSYQFGLGIEKDIIEFFDINLAIYLESYYNLNENDLKIKINQFDIYQDGFTAEFTSNGYGVGFGININYTLSSYFRLCTIIGYDFNNLNEVKLRDNNGKVQYYNQEYAPDWSGYRIGLQLDITLGEMEPS